MSSFRHRMRAIGTRLGVTIYRRTSGKGMEPGRPLGTVMLVVPGRRTSLPRSACVAFERLPGSGDLVVWGTGSGSPTDPDWFRNLRHAAATRTPVEAQVGNHHLHVSATELVGAERDRVWRDVVLARRPKVARYAEKAGRVIPVAVLHPLG